MARQPQPVASIGMPRELVPVQKSAQEMERRNRRDQQAILAGPMGDRVARAILDLAADGPVEIDAGTHMLTVTAIPK